MEGKMFKRLILAAVMLMVIQNIVPVAWADVPQTINYQGKLTDNIGNPVGDGDYQITFTIYNAPTGGTSQWTSGVQTVPVAGGLFNYQLQFSSTDHALFTDTLRWLGIKVGSDPEITPRTKLNSSPYAYHALRADTAAYAYSSGGAAAGGWTDDGIIVRLTTTTDSVGIGTNSPAAKLHVDGTLIVTNKAALGPGSTNPGVHAFVAGSNCNSIGNYSSISGGLENNATGFGGVVGGGRANAADNFAAVVGGSYNAALGSGSIVGGGTQETAKGIFSVVAGGNSNTANGDYGFVGAGQYNNARQYFSAVVAGKENDAYGSYSVVGGGRSDSVNGDYGGVFSGYGNRAGDEYSDTGVFIGGGYLNTALDMFTTIAGGYTNTAEGIVSTIGGGSRNRTVEWWGTIGGGDGNGVLGRYGTIAGGLLDTVHSFGGTVGGGRFNHSIAGYSTVSGGFDNQAGGYPDSAFGEYSTIGGGTKNRAFGISTTIAGGNENTACNENVTVGGGSLNHSCDTGSTISGGYHNYNDALYGVIGGGYENGMVGEYCVIPGGRGNSVGRLAPPYPAFSMAFGDGVCVQDSFRVVFFDGANSGRLGLNRDDCDDGGVLYPIHVGTDATNGNGAHLTEGGTWVNSSSREFKEKFQPLDARVLLKKISDLDIQSWYYKNTEERHIGPVAEDFVEAFNVGDMRAEDGQRDNHYISSADVAGVALVGVQELYRMVNELQEKTEKIEKLEQQMAQLEAMVEVIWSQQNEVGADGKELARNK